MAKKSHQSQNALVERDLKGHLAPAPCHGQGHLLILCVGGVNAAAGIPSLWVWGRGAGLGGRGHCPSAPWGSRAGVVPVQH